MIYYSNGNTTRRIVPECSNLLFVVDSKQCYIINLNIGEKVFLVVETDRVEVDKYHKYFFITKEI